LPASFAGGRYAVKSFLGEGGRKRVYLAHDTRLDRDVAVAVIKTERLDVDGLTRVRNEARAMARLSDYPNVVTVFDVGDDPSAGSGQAPSAGSGQGQPQPYMVEHYMAGGSVEELIAAAENHRLPLGDFATATPVAPLREAARQLGPVAVPVPEPALRLRIGLHTGEAIRDKDDFFGRNVTLAHRITDRGRGGQVLVSEPLREQLRRSRGPSAGSGQALRFDQGIEVELKGPGRQAPGVRSPVAVILPKAPWRHVTVMLRPQPKHLAPRRRHSGSRLGQAGRSAAPARFAGFFAAAQNDKEGPGRQAPGVRGPVDSAADLTPGFDHELF